MENKKITDLLEAITASEQSYTVVEDGLSTKKINIVNMAKVFLKGAILMWSGPVSQLPSGWVLCDGTNDTPDLRDRFIIASGRKYSQGNTGGAETHTLTVNEMPRHTHGPRATSNSGDTASGLYQKDAFGGRNLGYISYSHTNPAGNLYISETGGGAAHNNMPPYYALAFIMFKGL